MADGRPGAPRGHVKYGGRAAGVKNKSTRERERRITELLIAEQLTPEQQAEITPLMVMLRIMRARTRAGDDVGALIAAQLAAPYVHPKLSSSDVRITNEDTRKSDEAIEAELIELRDKLAAARVMN